ncbi:hypothetical protein GCM10025864_28180 [Luteimicrobium album]|uniref:Large extracellular alpha-helical protein n=1 Tax=Luteimicrobium album TaxID=1054550 RepID=A0ABQ6I2R5_9MICO|nr:hypothetical protein GCM10025864_28180 [Luteimicrobium album]
MAVALVAGGAALVPHVLPDLTAPASDRLAHRTSTVDVAPGDRMLVCPGPARLTDPDSGGDAQFRASPVPTTTRLGALALASGAGTLQQLDGSKVATLAASPGGDAASVLRQDTVPGGLALRAPAPDTGADRVAASVASTTTSGDLRGLVAASCQTPGTVAWLAGGDTKVGSSTQLVLQNPGLTPATVSVRAWGPDGEIPLASSASLVVPAGKEVVRLLEAAAPGVDRLVVQVKASGGLVSAYLQHSTLSGIVPQGVDDVVPGSAPAQHLALAGVVSRGEAIADTRAPVLRLLAPSKAAKATVSLWGPSGRVHLRGAEQVALDAGQVVDVPLGGLPAGTYTVTVDADQKVVAGIVEQRPGTTGAAGQPAPSDPHTAWDRAWVPAQAVPDAPPAGSPDAGEVALPAGTSDAVVLTALPADRSTDAKVSGEAKATVRLFDASGAQMLSRPTTVAAGTSAVLDVGALAPGKDVAGVAVDAVTPSGGATVAWGVVTSVGAASSGVPTGGASGQLVSVLAPVPSVSSGGTVAAQEDPTLGLP